MWDDCWIWNPASGKVLEVQGELHAKGPSRVLACDPHGHEEYKYGNVVSNQYWTQTNVLRPIRSKVAGGYVAIDLAVIKPGDDESPVIVTIGDFEKKKVAAQHLGENTELIPRLRTKTKEFVRRGLDGKEIPEKFCRWAYNPHTEELMNPASGKVLEIHGGDNTTVIAVRRHGGANQKWRFVPREFFSADPRARHSPSQWHMCPVGKRLCYECKKLRCPPEEAHIAHFGSCQHCDREEDERRKEERKERDRKERDQKRQEAVDNEGPGYQDGCVYEFGMNSWDAGECQHCGAETDY